MTNREKLTKLLIDISYNQSLGVYDLVDMRDGAGYIADLLIENGLVVREDCKSCEELTQKCILRLVQDIEEMQKNHEWIPVAERKPKELTCVLTWSKNNGYQLAMYTGCWFFMKVCEDPTHWMPLPKPPKKEENSNE